MTRSMIFAFLTVSIAAGQTGGTYQIEQSVIASGGAISSGANLLLTATGGQSLAGGNSTGGGYSVTPGFWSIASLAPTAAHVSVSGRVLTPARYGLVNAIVVIAAESGETRFARTGGFGYYVFENVEVGRTYIVRVESKRFQFAPRTISVLDTVSDLDFIPDL